MEDAKIKDIAKKLGKHLAAELQQFWSLLDPDDETSNRDTFTATVMGIIAFNTFFVSRSITHKESAHELIDLIKNDTHKAYDELLKCKDEEH